MIKDDEGKWGLCSTISHQNSCSVDCYYIYCTPITSLERNVLHLVCIFSFFFAEMHIEITRDYDDGNVWKGAKGFTVLFQG